ncbi:MAG: hypothetical protein Q4615_05430 [Paracoccus aminovorans]|nr:hypothetical protein [Paracoccus aminovorans]
MNRFRLLKPSGDGFLYGLLKPLLLLIGEAARFRSPLHGNLCVLLRLQPLLFGFPCCPVQTAAARPRPGLIVLRADLGMIAILPTAHDALVAARRRAGPTVPLMLDLRPEPFVAQLGVYAHIAICTYGHR